MNYSTTVNNIRPVTHQRLLFFRIPAFETATNLRHAIFTRSGGVSPAPYHSLNLSTATGDTPEHVAKNLQLACGALGLEVDQMTTCHLVHGTRVIRVMAINQSNKVDQADSLISNTPGVYLFMRFADCTPLLFFDPIARAVGLAHAGWRGTLKNAAGATVGAMVERLGCQAHNIIAVIGPAIGPCCYEVGAEVIEAVETKFEAVEKLLSHRNQRSQHAHFNLWEANRQQLETAGVKQIIQTNFCTACHRDKFFSHRADKGSTGRFGVVLGFDAEGMPA